MKPKTLIGSKKLGEKIRARWLELDLTIEEVALRAGIGTKRGAVTKPENPFGWTSEGDLQGAELAGYGGSERGGGGSFLLQKRKEHETWPDFLKERFGTQAAATFAMGSWRYLDSRRFFQSRF